MNNGAGYYRGPVMPSTTDDIRTCLLGFLKVLTQLILYSKPSTFLPFGADDPTDDYMLSHEIIVQL